MKQNIINAIAGFDSSKKVSVGFDGYIDRILRVRQHDAQGNRYIETIRQFGSYLLEKAGKSCSLELQQTVEKAGGNMPNYAAALSRLDVKVTCIGALGWPGVHPLFRDALKGCELFSMGQPGKSDALEFRDGKVMLAHNQDIDALDYPTFSSRVNPRMVAQSFADADLMAFFNWSEMKGATSIWAGLCDLIVERAGRPIHMLVDFSDCSGRSKEEILEIIGVLQRYQKAFSLYYSLNLNEAEDVARKLEIGADTPQGLARALFRRLQPEVVAIHLINGCVFANKEQEGFVPNRMIERPTILTGGGDNFNAGFSFGLLLGLAIPEALLLGNAVSGYYVLHGQSPNRSQLIQWLKE
ncbi:MAG TPA: carbohydrate kinase family protein [Clostridiales bacterium]|nr:carbohydrate kinase family protein [Clostridiales bacterium]